MSYTKHTWSDNEGGGTLITAQKLNEMEQGILDAQTGGVHIDTALDTTSTAPVTNKAIAEKFADVEEALDGKLDIDGITDITTTGTITAGTIADTSGNTLSGLATLVASALTVDGGLAELRLDNDNHRVILVAYKDSTRAHYYYITFSANGMTFSEV